MGLIVSPSIASVVDTTTTLQNAATATGNGTAITLTALTQEVLVTVTGADTPSGTLAFEHSYDGGSNYVAAYVESLVDTSPTLLTTRAISDTTVFRYRYRPPVGVNRFRARVSVYATGNLTATAIQRDRVS